MFNLKILSMFHVKPVGIPFGKKLGFYVCRKEEKEGHAIIFGRTGTGKSQGYSIPIAQCWRYNLLVLDMDGELYKVSKHCRHVSKVFDPLDNGSYGYDPYYMLRMADDPSNIAFKIAMMVVPDEKDSKASFWVGSAQNILAGAIMHFAHQGYSFIQTLEEVQRTLDLDSLLDTIRNSEVRMASRALDSIGKGTEDSQKADIRAELVRKTTRFLSNQTIVNCFSRENNIIPPDIEHCSIFFKTTHRNKKTLAPINTLMLEQFLDYLSSRPEKGIDPCAIIFEEGANIGRIPDLDEYFATLRKKRVSIVMIVQSPAQFDLKYSREERRVIVDNTDYLATLGMVDPESRKYVSALFGGEFTNKESRNTNFKGEGKEVLGTGTSVTKYKQPFIDPDDLPYLYNDALLMTPYMSLKMKKIKAYKDRHFKIPGTCTRRSFLSEFLKPKVQKEFDTSEIDEIAKITGGLI